MVDVAGKWESAKADFGFASTFIVHHSSFIIPHSSFIIHRSSFIVHH